MTVHTDNPAEIGLHVFERAGLGKGPFRCIGFEEKFYQAHPDAPRQPGGSCDYCGTGIFLQCKIRSADGKTFKVGSDCVAKTGDHGLIKSYQNNPQVRAAARAKRAAKADRVVTEWTALLADESNRAKLAALPTLTQYHWHANRLVCLEQTWTYCGATGKARLLKYLKAALAEVSA